MPFFSLPGYVYRFYFPRIHLTLGLPLSPPSNIRDFFHHELQICCLLRPWSWTVAI